MDAVDTLERPVRPMEAVPAALVGSQATPAPVGLTEVMGTAEVGGTSGADGVGTNPANPTPSTLVAVATEPAPVGSPSPIDDGDGDDAASAPTSGRSSVIDDPEAIELGRLVERARAGDRHAFVAIVDRCRPLVTRVARRYLANPADAEDVVQEVWLSLYEHIDRIHSPELVRSWLCRVTANAALRSQTRSSRVVLGPDVGERPSGESTEDQGLRRAAQDELSVAMDEALGRLRPQDSRLVALLMTEDRPDYRMVSALVDRPVGSIGPTRQRILERLRKDPAITNLRVSGPIVA